ncbi:MAG TPA: cobalamin-dependent protein [Baekduia sp.]|nr:cobalamin-dependent protein [Baekduia sp.]
MSAETIGALDGVRAAYVEALLAPAPADARALVAAAWEDGATAEELYLAVLTPAMEEIGRRWERAEISVAQEHLATQVTQAVLASLAGRLRGAAHAGAGRRVVVACTPGELHGLGAGMVADFLEADGWDVLALGPDTPMSALVDLAAEQRPEAVALSTSLPNNLLSAGRVFSALGRLVPRPLLVAGGRAYAGDAARAVAVGADVLARDPAELVAVLSRNDGSR